MLWSNKNKTFQDCYNSSEIKEQTNSLARQETGKKTLNKQKRLKNQ